MVFKYSDKRETKKSLGFDTESREYVPMDNLIDKTIIVDEVFPYHSKEYDCDGLFLSFEDGTLYTTTMSSTIVGKFDEELIAIINAGEAMEMTPFKRKSYKNKNREVVDFV